MSTDWLPGKRAEQLAMAKNWLEILQKIAGGTGPGSSATQAERWNIPLEIVFDFTRTITAAEAAFAEVEKPHSPIETAKCKETFDAMIAIMRDIKDRYYKKPPLADSDFVSLGLKPKDNIRTEHFDVTELLEVTTSLRGICEIVVHVRVKGSSSKARPSGYSGAVVATYISENNADVPPENPTDWQYDYLQTTPEYILHLDPKHRGKTIHISGSWQNARGNMGPYSEVVSAVIP